MSKITTPKVYMIHNVQYWSLQHMSNAIFFRQISSLFEHFTKMCSTKFPPFSVKASPKTAYHKIQWLQFANRNIVGLQSWHSSRHFQIPITIAILTLQLRLGTNCNFGLANTTICERGMFKQDWVESDHRSRLKLETLDALMWVSLYCISMENRDWARIFDTWKSTQNRRALP